LVHAFKTSTKTKSTKTDFRIERDYFYQIYIKTINLSVKIKFYLLSFIYLPDAKN
jgi:hypothetical protein